jgi:hypothetical protein
MDYSGYLEFHREMMLASESRLRSYVDCCMGISRYSIYQCVVRIQLLSHTLFKIVTESHSDRRARYGLSSAWSRLPTLRMFRGLAFKLKL